MTTLAQLRRDIASRLGSVSVATATAAGTTTTFVAAVDLNIEDGWKRNAIGILTGGTAANLYERVRVTASSKTSNSLTLTPELPAATQAGDVIELYRERDDWLTPYEIDDAIVRSVRYAPDAALVAATDASQDFVATSPTVDIPAEWRVFAGVRVTRQDGTYWQARAADLSVDVFARTVTLMQPLRQQATGKTIELLGYTRPVAPSDDTDDVGIDDEWLIANCCSELNATLARRLGPTNGVAREREATRYMQLAQLLRTKVTKRSNAPAGKLWTLPT